MSPVRGLTVSFRTLGCKVNRVESEKIAAELLGQGVQVAEESAADVIVINTCTVTGEADAKARKAVRHALRLDRQPVVVVTGCLASVDAVALTALGERVIVEADKSRVADRVAMHLALRPARQAAAPTPVPRTGDLFRTRVSIKIEDGCDNFCTYCIVPYARGVPRGEPLADIVAEAETLVAVGVSELVLTGINLGRYRDPHSDADLADLIAAVAATGVARLRLSSIEPPDLTPRLLAVLAETPSACAQLHVPLQSGSDEVLSAMGRAYTSAEFRGLVTAARETLPGLTLTTDVIAGFPTETAENHAETLAFIESLGFSKLHVFRYSERPGTPAAALPQVPAAVRSERAAELRALGEKLRAEFLSAHVGGEVEVLVEAAEGGRVCGTTRDYVRVELPGTGLARGDVSVVRVEAVRDGRLVAR